MATDIKGQRVLITGASRGLGACVARAFAAEGCSIALNYFTSKGAADAVAEEIAQKHGVKTVVLQADCEIEADCVRLVKEAAEALGGLDIVIGNAGWTRIANWENLHSMSVAEWEKCFRVNVISNMVLLREAKPLFLSQPHGGCFIMTSSTSADVPDASSMAYACSKAAQHHLMRGLAKTQGPRIRVGAVKPGLILTDWGKRFDPAYIKEMEKACALGKLADLDDCAQAFVFMAKNSSMTGQSITVDGGEVI